MFYVFFSGIVASTDVNIEIMCGRDLATIMPHIQHTSRELGRKFGFARMSCDSFGFLTVKRCSFPSPDMSDICVIFIEDRHEHSK